MEGENGFLNLDNYEKQTRIGIGGFGEVFKLIEKRTGRIYAAKISLIDISEDQSDEQSLIIELKHEVNILAQLNHPSILKFIGYSPVNFKNEPKPVIITEFVSNGSLKEMIQLEQNSKQPELWNDTKKLINIYGIASAMSYLHSHNIIHRDLKTGNILEDDYLFPKIADFGLSKFYHQNEESMSIQSTKELKGTPKYVAPESWESYEYTKEGDVYSFSFIVYQILTHEEPFKNFNMQMIYSKVVKKGLRPEFTKPIGDSYRELIQQCWESDPKKRPTFDQIVERLRTDPGFITANIDKEKYLYYINMIDNYQKTYDPSKKFTKVVLSEYKKEENIIEKNEIETKKISSVFDKISQLNEFNSLNEETKDFLKQTLSNTQSKSLTIPTNKTILLFANEDFYSPEFISILNFFDKILIEFKYPSNIFEQILNSISNLMNSKIAEKIKIRIVIAKTDKIKDYIQNVKMPISIVIDQSVSEIDECAFNRCSSLTEISIPSSIKKIGSYAFSGCSKITRIAIPSSVTQINSYAFCGCSNLTQIVIPSSVTEIGSGAFSFCSKLTEMRIPFSVTQINESLFEGCSSMTKVSFESDSTTSTLSSSSSVSTTVSDSVLVTCSVNLIACKAFKSCVKLSFFAIPSSVVVIDQDAFESCTSLSKISIPSSVKEIRSGAFSCCSSLAQIDFVEPSSITTIGEKAFSECSSLKEIIIPASVTEIGGKVFEGCKSLTQISIPSSFKKLFLSRHFGIDKSVKIIKT